MKILVVNTSNRGGGAERIAQRLTDGLAARGFQVRLAVGVVGAEAPNVTALSRRRDDPARNPAAPRPAGSDDRKWALRAGVEDFFYPGSWDLLDAADGPPDLVHLHNLHGAYFDLRLLPWLSSRLPVVLTLHDQWLLTGHCAHPLGCDRWKTGCGLCPDISLYPPLPVDNTANNHTRKREILADCALHVAAPSRWLLERARCSILAPAMRESRCLPNGIDLSLFSPGDRAAERRALGLPADAFITLFVANGGTRNPWRDVPAMMEVRRRLEARRTGRDTLLIVLGLRDGEPAEAEDRVLCLPFIDDPRRLVAYYRAADVCLHIAKADTFPTVVLEAMACGTPVVANAVGGIPEQVVDLTGPPEAPDKATGALFADGDLDRAVTVLARLALDRALHDRIAGNAARHARRFDEERWLDEHVVWYERILARRAAGSL